MAKDYSCICGVEIEDLSRYFGEHIENLESSDELKRYGSLHDEILAWYDGYSWDGKTRVINPFSLLSFLTRKEFFAFWYSSGSPKFLMDLIKRRPEGYAGLENPEIGEWALDTFDIDSIEAGLLLFQTGYLTVKEKPEAMGSPVYHLGMPNHEVREAFNLHILAAFTESETHSAAAAYRRMKESLQTGDLQGLLEVLRGHFAKIPYILHISREAYYHSIFLSVMILLGFKAEAEVMVAGGRIDATLDLTDKAYVMEFKYIDCPEDTGEEEKQKLYNKALDVGMKQIEDKGYAKKYAGSGKTVYKAAFAFLGRSDIEMRVW
jgi:hypothetical protein